MWVDTHCHLDAIDDEATAIVGRALEAGVDAIVTVGTDVASSAASVELAGRFDQVWAAVGIHPHEAATLTPESLEAIRALASLPKVVAIGEIGLDFFRDYAPRDAQIQAFRAQLALAVECDLPVVIHVRDSFDDVLDILGDFIPGVRAVFHCFSGGAAEAERALGKGAYISFAGNVSYKSAESLREAARATPLDRMLVETDSPYLPPVPHRGKGNEPAFIKWTGAALAEALGIPVEELAKQTSANARQALLGEGRGVGS